METAPILPGFGSAFQLRHESILELQAGAHPSLALITENIKETGRTRSSLLHPNSHEEARLSFPCYLDVGPGTNIAYRALSHTQVSTGITLRHSIRAAYLSKLSLQASLGSRLICGNDRTRLYRIYKR